LSCEFLLLLSVRRSISPFRFYLVPPSPIPPGSGAIDLPFWLPRAVSAENTPDSVPRKPMFTFPFPARGLLGKLPIHVSLPRSLKTFVRGLFSFSLHSFSALCGVRSSSFFPPPPNICRLTAPPPFLRARSGLQFPFFASLQEGTSSF